jgi:glucokinase
MRGGRRTLLLVDIGGTKTEAVEVSLVGGTVAAAPVTTLVNEEFDGPEGVLDRFVAESAGPARVACVAVAGPVRDGRARLTNLPWELNERELARRYSLEKAFLVNDVHALGCLVPHLRPTGLATLAPGPAARSGTLVVVSPGTGLGVSFVVWGNDRYRAFPSEAGNAPFAPTTPEQLDLLRFVRGELDDVRVEDLCSGPGIERIYRFLPARDEDADAGCLPGSGRRASPLADGVKTPEIVASATSAEATERSRETLRLFVEILADFARSAALSFVATGGVYVAGALPLRLRPLLSRDFARAFTCSSGRGRVSLEVPVHLVTREHPVLCGAHCFAMQELGIGRRRSAAS